MKKSALLNVILLIPQISSAVKIYSPFYDTYQEKGASYSTKNTAVPQGKYRTGWRAGRYRAHWHDTHPSQMRREK